MGFYHEFKEQIPYGCVLSLNYRCCVIGDVNGTEYYYGEDGTDTYPRVMVNAIDTNDSYDTVSVPGVTNVFAVIGTSVPKQLISVNGVIGGRANGRSRSIKVTYPHPLFLPLDNYQEGLVGFFRRDIPLDIYDSIIEYTASAERMEDSFRLV